MIELGLLFMTLIIPAAVLQISRDRREKHERKAEGEAIQKNVRRSA